MKAAGYGVVACAILVGIGVFFLGKAIDPAATKTLVGTLILVAFAAVGFFGTLWLFVVVGGHSRPPRS